MGRYQGLEAKQSGVCLAIFDPVFLPNFLPITEMLIRSSSIFFPDHTMKHPPKRISADLDPRPSDWECHKHEIRHLYVDRNLPLAEVQKRMSEQYGFEATYVTSIIHIATAN